MTSRSRAALEIATVSLMVALAVFHFLGGAYRTAWWPITFLLLSMPVLFSLLVWSFRRDMRVLHDRGHLAVPSRRLETEVTLAVVSLFVWIGFVVVVVRGGLPDRPSSPWLAALFLVWLAWFASAMWRARGYAFTLREAKP